jgi:hypothetical protein
MDTPLAATPAAAPLMNLRRLSVDMVLLGEWFTD